MVKIKILSGFLIVISITQVYSYPRKRLVNSLTEPNKNSRLASVLSDYWTERGFHDTLADNLMASESEAKDLMVSGDEAFSNYRGRTKIRIPRERLTPPRVASKHRAALNKLSRNKQKRKRPVAVNQHYYRYPRVRVMNHLVPVATRKQDDMEILESVTLIDGGSPQTDGTIKIRESNQQSQRKYHQELDDEDQISPLNYHLQDDDLTLAYKQQQQLHHQGQPQPRQPALSASYHAMPNEGYQYPHENQGKLSVGQMKQPKSIPLPSMSLNQFQQQLFQQQQQPQPQNHGPDQLSYNTPKPQVVPIFVIPTSTKAKQEHQAPPPPPPPPSHNSPQPYNQPAPYNHQSQPPHSPPPPPPPPTPSPQYAPTTTTPPPPPPQPQQTTTGFNSQLFQQQFKHPFATQAPSKLSSLAQLTATLLSGASSVAAATSAAASALAKGELPLTLPPQQSHAEAESAPFPSYAGMPHHQYGPLAGGLLASASIPSASQILLPTNPIFDATPQTTLRPGVIVNDEQLAQDQLGAGQPETLANQITRLVETGRKILYFPKGVMDTVDVFLKQMERNPMVAYWGDKFFAKVFGDTSGT